MDFKWLNKRKKQNIENGLSFLNKGFIICESCKSQHMLNFYKPLSFSKCSKCGAPIFIPHKVSDYWLREPLGSGGMGSVYKADHCKTGEKFSVKLLQRDSKTDQEVVDALLYEGKVGMEISGHINVCEVVDYGTQDDEVYVVSRFLDGIRLDVLIENKGPASEENALRWALQLLSALNHIYKAGYIYRDMKPQNIIIDRRNKKATLFDYGLCQKVDEQNVDDEHIIGSPMFLPPERCVQEKEDMYSEIYSLGMVLFYTLAGKAYYNSDDVQEIISLHVRKIRMWTIESFLPDTNPDVIKIIDKMIKRFPADRYQSYGEVYNDIKQLYDVYKSF